MGDHAGESADTIFNRKKADIEKIGETFWLIRSPKAKPEQVQGVCKTTQAYAIFVEPATKGGARPTIEEDPAKECSNDRVLWNPLPNGLSPVRETGFQCNRPCFRSNGNRGQRYIRPVGLWRIIKH
jgi:hypothetical protein